MANLKGDKYVEPSEEERNRRVSIECCKTFAEVEKHREAMQRSDIEVEKRKREEEAAVEMVTVVTDFVL